MCLCVVLLSFYTTFKASKPCHVSRRATRVCRPYTDWRAFAIYETLYACNAHSAYAMYCRIMFARCPIQYRGSAIPADAADAAKPQQQLLAEDAAKPQPQWPAAAAAASEGSVRGPNSEAEWRRTEPDQLPRNSGGQSQSHFLVRAISEWAARPPN